LKSKFIKENPTNLNEIDGERILRKPLQSLADVNAAGVIGVAAVVGEQQIQVWEVKDINLLDTAPASVCPSYELPCDAFIPTTQLLLLMTTTLTLHPNA
jgi:hypothetical protein